MNLQWGRATLVVTCWSLVTACDTTTDIEPRSGEVYRCPTWQCGYNSAELHGSTIDELNLDGAPNDAGARLVGFVPPKGNAAKYTLDVVGDELVATAKDAPALKGESLIGASLTLVVQGTLTSLQIDGVRREPSWAAQGAPVTSYRFTIDGVNLCKAGQKSEDTAFAVVLGGERYDEQTLTAATSPRWFSFGCGTTALAKAALMGYGPQTAFPGEKAPASRARRQATLKMLTADYCGVGHSYTEDSVFLLYANHSGTIAPLSQVEPGPLEAIWTEHGALCLEEPRLAAKVELCDLPACDGLDLGDGEWITHLP